MFRANEEAFEVAMVHPDAGLDNVNEINFNHQNGRAYFAAEHEIVMLRQKRNDGNCAVKIC